MATPNAEFLGEIRGVLNCGPRGGRGTRPATPSRWTARRNFYLTGLTVPSYSTPMFTDADIEMAELRQAAADADAGICSICGDALDPTHPKWAGEFPKADGTTAERWAELVGPVDTNLRLHRWCLSDHLI